MTMKADDATDTLELALKASGCVTAVSRKPREATVVHRPKLLSDNGSSYVAGDLATWLEKRNIIQFAAHPIIPRPKAKSSAGIKR